MTQDLHVVKKKCIYCGSDEDLTRDHIPPQCLFPNPKPSNMITVPACRTCNGKWSQDDEYFRAVMVSDIKVWDNPNAQKVNQSLLRSVRKPNKRGFAAMIRQSLHDVELRTSSGLYLGKTPAFVVDAKRFNATAERIFRGLYFWERKYNIPNGYKVWVHIPQFNPNETLMQTLKSGFWTTPVIIGDNVFGYNYAPIEPDPNCIAFQSKFYNTLDIFGFILPETIFDE